jgi:hypothetical protein
MNTYSFLLIYYFFCSIYALPTSTVNFDQSRGLKGLGSGSQVFDIQKTISMAIELIQKKDFSRAIDILRSILNTDPFNIDANQLLGEKFFTLNECIFISLIIRIHTFGYGS